MTLDGLEAMLAEKLPKAKRMGLKMNMVRYADDFIVTGNSKEWLEQEVKPAVVEFLAERGLALSPEKTKITHVRDGFDFLGVEHSQVRWQVVDEAVESERQSAS